ncbi:MAG: AMP-binding protein [Planctomycetota bacterium]|nr:AMP-binding protein [Planctomycetota bacterium]
MPAKKSLFEHFSHQAHSHPTATALESSRGHWNYAELLAAVKNLAAKLQVRIPPSSTVAVFAGDDPGYIPLALALDSLKTTQVPVPKEASDQQKQWIKRDSGAGFYVSYENEKLTIEKLGESRRWEGSRCITYTSGTTGRPKGVVLPLGAEEELANALISLVGQRPERTVSLLPISLFLEWVLCVYLPLSQGHTVTWIKDKVPCFGNDKLVNLQSFLAHIAKANPSYLFVPPQVLSDLLKFGDALPQLFPKTLRFLGTGGAPADPEVLRSLTELGIPVFEGYGLSEAGAIVASNGPNFNRPGTVGRVLKHRELRFANDGEILIRGPGTMMSYTDGSNPTDQDGFVHTGDIGAFDADGYLKIVGRKKSILITGYGRNLSADWIRQLFEESPLIQRCTVKGEGLKELEIRILPSPACNEQDTHVEALRLRQELPRHTSIKFHYDKA